LVKELRVSTEELTVPANYGFRDATVDEKHKQYVLYPEESRESGGQEL